MNCINHVETPVSSYCQNCGKPLCAQCTRSVAGFVYCEQCLAAKVGVPGAQPGAPFPPGIPPVPGNGPNPALAALLGIMPGVGAMFNGQFVKAMVHVLVFVVLIAVAQEHNPFGIFVAAWMFYQVFDAYQTAKARRDGQPLPDPFGLNELGSRLGGHYSGGVPRDGSQPPIHPFSGFTPPSPPAAGFTAGTYPPSYPPPGTPPPPAAGAPYPPAEPYYVDVPPVPFPEPARRNEPAGAIVLIVLGIVFLFGTMDIFRFDWIERGWPLIIIGVGIWLFLKRARETKSQGGGQ